jgi:hypothetical protein
VIQESNVTFFEWSLRVAEIENIRGFIDSKLHLWASITQVYMALNFESRIETRVSLMIKASIVPKVTLRDHKVRELDDLRSQRARKVPGLS